MELPTKNFTGIIVLILLVVFLTHGVSACVLSTELINQDPYPAIPGESVDVVFQLKGIGDPTCKIVNFKIVEEFPFTLKPGQKSEIQILGGTSAKDFQSFAILPFTFIVDKNALDGDNPIEVLYGQQNLIEKEFNISIEDARTDFEVSIKDYEKTTNTLTLEILNIGKNDVEALTIEIPKQDNIEVKGSVRNVVGSLDANEDTTFSFEAIPKDGEIKLTILYTDSTSERRVLEKTIIYDSEYFTGRVGDKTKRSVSFYLLIVLIILVVGYWIFKRWKKNKAKKHSHMKS